jgi:hypothetical protein
VGDLRAARDFVEEFLIRSWRSCNSDFGAWAEGEERLSSAGRRRRFRVLGVKGVDGVVLKDIEVGRDGGEDAHTSSLSSRKTPESRFESDLRWLLEGVDGCSDATKMSGLAT